MKSRIKIVFCLALALFFLSESVSASTLAQDMVKPAQVYICTAYGVLKNILGPLALFFLILAGFMWARSEDDAQGRLQAKTTIVTILIGLIIFLVASGTVYVLTYAATGGTLAFTMSSFCP
ncbi:MAG: TrbC/VirB2 family protein [Candidatus Altiarchaeota archaeon]